MTAATLVLVHGAGGNERIWAPLAAHLGELAVSISAPSLPGRCHSEGPPCATVTQAAEWLDGWLAARGIRQAVVAGHSYGGAVAIELALLPRRRTSLAGLVLMSTGARLRVHPAILQWVEQAAGAGTAVDLGRAGWQPGTDEALIERIEAASARTPPATALADWRAADAFDRMGDLDRIEVPSLVVGGAEDVLTPPKYARYLAERIPRAELVLLDGAGHMAPFEHAARVARLLARFVGQAQGAQ